MFALNGSIRCFLYLTCGESPLQDALLLIILQSTGMNGQICAVLHIVNGQVGQSGMEHVQVADVLPDVLGQLIENRNLHSWDFIRWKSMSFITSLQKC